MMDERRHAYVLYLCCGHAFRPARTPQAATRRRPRLHPRQTGRPGPPLRRRHAAHRGRAGRGRRRVAHPGAGGAAAPGGRRADQAYPKKGALVLPVSAQEIKDVVETRILVEEHAARKAVPAPPGLIERLEELLARQKEQAAAGDLAAAAVTDRCFHAEIVRSGGNEILSRLYDQLRDRQLRMGVALMYSHPDRIAKTLVEHEEILQALRSGDTEAAVGLVHRHIDWFSHLARGEER